MKSNLTLLLLMTLVASGDNPSQEDLSDKDDADEDKWKEET